MDGSVLYQILEHQPIRDHRQKVYTRRAVTVPHALVGVAIAGVWAFSLFTDRHPEALVQAFAAIAVLTRSQ